jgi:UDP-N-acetylmuramyl pentapeptide phosphotransferase/UDP-N-acetylglucosamine-1-phosphate transferase
MVLLLCLLVPMLVVAALSPWAVRVCARKNLVVDVCDKRSHTNPTPHGGAFVLVAVALLFMLPLLIFVGGAYDKAYMLVLLLASVPVAVVGWLDDVKGVSPSKRLVVHVLAVSIAVVMLPPLFDFMPLVIEKIILVLGWAWFVSLFNFMNGADGLAETQAIWSALMIMLLVPALAPFCAVLAGVCVGFLRVNWHPAKVFMGDVGSTWLGFMLAGLLLYGASDDTWRMIWPLAAVPLLFCYDATYTLMRRLAGGHNLWARHKTFWFHRILALGWRHDELVWGLLAANTLIALALLFEMRLGVRGLALAIGFVVVAGVSAAVQRTEKRKGIKHNA